MSIRFVTPGLSGERTISFPESVTALPSFLRIVFSSSRTRTVPDGVPPVVDIFRSGSCRSMIRAPTSGTRSSGTTSVSPKRSLKRRAISRISSTCWRWSSPTGTSVAR